MTNRMEAEDIFRAIPHRYPMLLVDRVIECDGVKRIVAIKNLSVNEPFFQGHFPGVPVMPGVLQIEAMAQAGGILFTQIAGGTTKVPYLMAVDKAKFRKVLRPGDQLRIEVDLVTMRSRIARFQGRVLIDGELASEATLMCMISERETQA